MARDFVEIGLRLIEVRIALPRGPWLRWLNQEFQWGQSSANKFMQAAEAFGSKLLQSGNFRSGFSAGPHIPRHEPTRDLISVAVIWDSQNFFETKSSIGY
jgi:hypothetical protein